MHAAPELEKLSVQQSPSIIWHSLLLLQPFEATMMEPINPPGQVASGRKDPFHRRTDEDKSLMVRDEVRIRENQPPFIVVWFVRVLRM